jgi:hypothetical protein
VGGKTILHVAMAERASLKWLFRSMTVNRPVYAGDSFWMAGIFLLWIPNVHGI